MNNQAFANITFLVLGIVSFILAARALYVYKLSKSDYLFVIGVAMADNAISIIASYLQDVHLISWNGHLSWYLGSTLTAVFLVLGSWATSQQQIATIKHWLIILTALYFVQTLLTPIMPQFPNPYIPAFLNITRTAIALTGSVRYFMLYSSKHTRFTLLMSIAFLLIGSGFGVLTPQIFNTSLDIFLTIGYSLRLVGYSALLTAYTRT